MRMSLMRRVLALRRARSWAGGLLSSLTTLVESEVSSWAVPVTRCLVTTIFVNRQATQISADKNDLYSPRVRRQDE